MNKQWVLSVALVLLSSSHAHAADWFNWLSGKKSEKPAPAAVQDEKQVPRVITEWSDSLEFGDNAYSMYEFDGRDNKLTCNYISEWFTYVEYPTDEKKSYPMQEGTSGIPTYGFDKADTWRKIPGTDMQLCQCWVSKNNDRVANDTSVIASEKHASMVLDFRKEWHNKKQNRASVEQLLTATKTQTNATQETAYQALKCDREKVVWKSALIKFPELLIMHSTLPYFAVGEKNLITLYNRAIFTDGAPVEPLATISVNKNEFEPLRMTWHPTEYKLLVKTDEHMIAEYNGDSKKIEKQFPMQSVWLDVGPQRSVYVSDTKQIVTLGRIPGYNTGLYELREGAEPRQLDTMVDGKSVYCNKIIGVVKQYLIVESMFLDNLRFLGVYDTIANKLHNVHPFKTEQGSTVFDPNTLKMFEIGHRIFWTYPDKCQVYNRECSILKLELPSSVDSAAKS